MDYNNSLVWCNKKHDDGAIFAFFFAEIIYKKRNTIIDENGENSIYVSRKLFFSVRI